MHLTQFTDYSLRVLIYLGVSENDATISEIADRYSISRNHLVKVVHRLGQLEYIHTTRGRNGGLSLKVDPKTITLDKIVKNTEPNSYLIECFDQKNNRCILSSGCKLKSVLVEAERAFLDVLRSYTLEDVLRNKHELQGLLHIDITSLKK